MVFFLVFSPAGVFAASMAKKQITNKKTSILEFESKKDPFAPMFKEVAQHWDIPQEWTEAIAQAESRRHPWTLNIEGKGFYFETKDAALTAAQNALESGKSFDCGIMQVNSFWLKKYNIPLEAVFDPLANIYLGGFILKGEIKRHGFNSKAIGAYHSPNPDKARNYANIILGLLNEPSAEKIHITPTPPAPLHKEYDILAPMLVKSTATEAADKSDALKVALKPPIDKSMKVLTFDTLNIKGNI